MKDIKSFLIGFLSCVCLMLFMGQTESNYTMTKEEYLRMRMDVSNYDLLLKLEDIESDLKNKNSNV